MPHFDDDGKKLNPDLIPKPSLCVACCRDEDESEKILCNLTRFDQRAEAEFICFAFEPIVPSSGL